MDWSNAFVLMFFMACVTFLIFIFIQGRIENKDLKLRQMKELNNTASWTTSSEGNALLNERLLKLLREL